ncbi:MAG TPA: secretin and TonB N-terminal domain-containing protein, partial [Armatimonadota bacterium]|nr:secretin and TonB N-terminal domain-containing protein [Armatimonadota bacterium]
MKVRPVGWLFLTLVSLLCGALPCKAQEPSARALPLREVVLFNSGVGYFQRAGRLEGSATIPLSFRAEQINDILKSLVLFDPAGSVRPVGYSVKDAAARRFLSAGQSLDQGVSLGALLRRFQGARVRLDLGAEPAEGRIVSVSTRPLPVKDTGAAQGDVVNLLTEEGLRAIPLESVARIKLLDERLDRELRESLELLARGRDDQRQGVELHFGGQGAREVRAGYLQETPVWKTSYRLVLDTAGKPYLQGWAIVENTTEEDWKDVRLSLVSGRPVSFIQDLYQPLYVPRPVVQAQVIGSPVPQTYGEMLEGTERRAGALAPGGGGFGGGGFGGMGGGFGGSMGGGLGGRSAAVPPGINGVRGMPTDNSLLVQPDRRVTLSFKDVPLREALQRLFEGTGLQYVVEPDVPDVPVTVRLRDVALQSALRLIIGNAAVQAPGVTMAKEADIYSVRVRRGAAAGDEVPPEVTADDPAFGDGLAQSVTAAVTGAERGELFEYKIEQPVSIARGQAAMVPIVTTAVEGEALSIFDPAADPRRALVGFRLRNTTGLHLSGGPVTVFRDGGYAGDAQITQLQPKEVRLLSYAVDLELVADHEAPQFRQETLSVTAKSGVLRVVRKQQREHRYTFRNKGEREKTVLVQQDREEPFKLVEPAQP